MFLESQQGTFRRRALSSLVLMPIFFLAVWLGVEGFAAFIAVCSVLMVWEWTRLCLGRWDWTGWIVSCVSCLAVYVALSHPHISLVLLVCAATVLLMICRSLWMPSGLVYIGGASVSLAWLFAASGPETLLWLVFVVWATDTGAYAFGRMVGGPRLAPRISPNKTWAGLLGGVCSAAAIGGLFPFFLGFSAWTITLWFAVVLACVAQGGDLLESYLKRRFGVKDSGSIIPGHGGVLDRMDGLIAAAPVVAVVVALWGGGLETW